jgi:hypothetical protein
MQNIMRKKHEQNNGQRDRSARASESERASARALQERGAAAGFHPAPFGYVDLGCYPPVMSYQGFPVQVFLFFQIAKKSDYLA